MEIMLCSLPFSSNGSFLFHLFGLCLEGSFLVYFLALEVISTCNKKIIEKKDVSLAADKGREKEDVFLIVLTRSSIVLCF